MAVHGDKQEYGCTWDKIIWLHMVSKQEYME